MRISAIYLVLLVFVVSCSKIPSYVIDKDDMASVMADMHIGESVVELNRKDYHNDSLKMMMKQSVLERHSVTSQEFDTSLEWYSHNIVEYIDLYDKTIAILEKRIAETGNRIAAENISMAGDSVDVWSSAHTMSLNVRAPSQYVTFSLNADDNWERGDYYTWRAKFFNNPEASTCVIGAEYPDGSSEYVTQDFTGDGWHEVNFVADSTRLASKIFGYLKANVRGETSFWIDSVMLVRNRLTPERYRKHYNQTRIRPKNLRPEENADTIDAHL